MSSPEPSLAQQLRTIAADLREEADWVGMIGTSARLRRSASELEALAESAETEVRSSTSATVRAGRSTSGSTSTSWRRAAAMDTPSVILNRAADLIRDTAGLALAPPWINASGTVYQGKDEDYVVATCPTSTTARWIALLNPDVAPALEAMLRASVGMWRLYENRGWSDEQVRAHVGSVDIAALDFARAVLGLVDTPKETT